MALALTLALTRTLILTLSPSQARGLGPVQRARYSWALKRAGGRTGYPSAAVRTLAALSQA